ncbi:MAG: hypothetical protein J0651_01925, partial [Actinobacteria bacterium]|nr:hypothetical protein [Actinomycetota bacterium]
MPLTRRTEGLVEDPVLHSATTRFTAAAGFDFKKFVQKVVRTNDVFHPSTRIFGVVMLWNPRKKQQHFFNDAYFSQKVFSDEIGADSFVDFLTLRGWSVNRKKTRDGEIEIDFTYRRMGYLMQQRRISGKQKSMLWKYFQLMALMERVLKYLRSPGAFSHTQSRSPEPKLVDQIKDAVVQETETKKGSGSRRKKKTTTDSRNVREHQYLQIALTTIQVCFGPVMPALLRTDNNNQHDVEKLFGLIFNECKTRRKLLEGLQDLFMFCKDKKTIVDNKSLLLAWLNNPTQILKLARTKRNTFFIADGSY